MSTQCMQYVLLVTIFCTGGNFQPVSNFMKLHATLVARSYVLLLFAFMSCVTFLCKFCCLHVCIQMQDSLADQPRVEGTTCLKLKSLLLLVKSINIVVCFHFNKSLTWKLNAFSRTMVVHMFKVTTDNPRVE